MGVRKLTKRFKAALWPRLVKRLPFSFQMSHSQFGEDMILSWLFRHYRGRPGFFVDIGAYHPITFSNTYALYCRGWRGINVEPRPGALAEFTAFRSRDVNLQLCVTPEPAGDVTLYEFEEGIHNTIDPADADNSVAEGRKLVAKHLLPSSTLSRLLNSYMPPGTNLDLLTIDVEGVDEAILQSFDWSRYAPMVVVFESRGNSYSDVIDLPIVKDLDKVGYDVVAKCGESIVARHRDKWAVSFGAAKALRD